ncbi:MAG TPA: DMT family transporter [Solirubrobacteraceae bacterium]
MSIAAPRRTAVPTAFAVAAGAGLAAQAYINGRLGRSLGSAELAATINNVTGLSVLAVIMVVTGAAPRALRRRADVRPWHLLGGLGGAMLVAAGAIAAPEIGVALLSLALVCGQTSGSLVADRVGLSPAGRRDITPARMGGVALAVAAVTLSALGAHTSPQAGLIAFAVVAGVANALQQAANGHLARVTGEPVFAMTVNFLVGAAALAAVAAVVTGLSPPHGWSAPVPEYLAGVIGAAVATTMVVTVSRLGVLRLMLGVIAGQAAGGLVVDLVAPIHGETVTAATVVGVALTFLAVLVTGRDRHVAR